MSSALIACMNLPSLVIPTSTPTTFWNTSVPVSFLCYWNQFDPTHFLPNSKIQPTSWFSHHSCLIRLKCHQYSVASSTNTSYIPSSVSRHPHPNYVHPIVSDLSTLSDFKRDIESFFLLLTPPQQTCLFLVGLQFQHAKSPQQICSNRILNLKIMQNP